MRGTDSYRKHFPIGGTGGVFGIVGRGDFLKTEKWQGSPQRSWVNCMQTETPDPKATPAACSHGQIRRACYTCELEEQIATLEARIKELESRIVYAAGELVGPTKPYLSELKKERDSIVERQRLESK